MPYRRPSPAYAKRQLAKVQAQLDALRAQNCLGDWRKACDKARALASLEAQEAKWQAILAPKLERFYSLPF